MNAGQGWAFLVVTSKTCPACARFSQSGIERNILDAVRQRFPQMAIEKVEFTHNSPVGAPPNFPQAFRRGTNRILLRAFPTLFLVKFNGAKYSPNASFSQVYALHHNVDLERFTIEPGIRQSESPEGVVAWIQQMMGTSSSPPSTQPTSSRPTTHQLPSTHQVNAPPRNPYNPIPGQPNVPLYSNTLPRHPSTSVPKTSTNRAFFY